MGSKCQTLIVEDDGIARDALSRLVGALGHSVNVARTLAEAVDQLSSCKPDCLLLDLLLPDGQGVSLLRKIRTRRLGIRVAVITGAEDPKLLSTVQDLRPDGFFRKPLHIADFMQWLRSPARPAHRTRKRVPVH